MRTEESIKKLLPIGSVVKLKQGTKSLMIMGVCQTDQQDGREYDYIGVLWPEGYMSTDTNVLFDESAIDKLLFRGADGIDRDEFLEKLVGYYSSKK